MTPAAPVVVDKSGGRIAEVDGSRVHYYDHGRGDAVVMLHGGGPGATGWGNWSQNIAPLAAHARVIVPDLPGFGDTSIGDDGAAYLSSSAGVLAGLLDHLDVERASFVGNSLGGGAALELALRHPDRVHRLVLLNPAGSPQGLFAPEPGAEMRMLTGYYDPPGASVEKMRAFSYEMVFDPAVASAEFVAERYEESIAPGRPEGQQAAIRGLKAQEAEAGSGSLWLRCSKVSQPTLLIWGREDRAAPLDKALMWLKRIPDARLIVIPQCGHWVQMEHAAEFERLTLEFISPRET